MSHFIECKFWHIGKKDWVSNFVNLDHVHIISPHDTDEALTHIFFVSGDDPGLLVKLTFHEIRCLLRGLPKETVDTSGLYHNNWFDTRTTYPGYAALPPVPLAQDTPEASLPGVYAHSIEECPHYSCRERGECLGIAFGCRDKHAVETRRQALRDAPDPPPTEKSP